MQVKIPKSSDDLRIRHFKAFEEFDLDGMNTMDEARLTASFIGKPINVVLAMDHDDFKKMYSHIKSVMLKMKVNPKPPEEITLDGKEYVLINPNKTATMWHADWGEFVKEGGFDKDPVRCACLFYHPKGHFYGELDRNENLVHPVRDKYQTFRDHLPLSTFIECSTFFLTRSLRLMIKSTERKKNAEMVAKMKEKILRQTQFLRGKKSSTI